MKRLIYLAVCGVLATAAGVLTIRAQHTVAVLVATHDISSGGQLQSSDVEVRQLSADGVPAGTILNSGEAIGRYVSWPLAGGEPILARELRTQRSSGAAQLGFALPRGYRAVAVSVLPAGAVGGMLASGDRVDVYATPSVGHQSQAAAAVVTNGADTSGGDPAPGAAVIGTNVLVLELRSDQGQPLEQPASAAGGATVHGLNFGSTKLGSVVLAVPSGEADRYASAAASMTVYLALDVS